MQWKDAVAEALGDAVEGCRWTRRELLFAMDPDLHRMDWSGVGGCGKFSSEISGKADWKSRIQDELEGETGVVEQSASDMPMIIRKPQYRSIFETTRLLTDL